MRNKITQKVDTMQTYLNEMESLPVLTCQEELELFKKYKNGDEETKEQLIVRNLKLVVIIAKKYRNTYKNNSSLSLQDLIQEGNLGLIRAVENFDYQKNYKFSTYTYRVIESTIKRAICSKSSAIRVPVNLKLKLLKYKEKIEKLERKLGRMPTEEEIKKEIGVNISKEELLKYCNIGVLSLDEAISDEKEGTSSKFISNLSSEEPSLDELIINKDRISQIRNLIQEYNLTPKQVDIIIKRSEGVILAALAETYHQTIENIRTIEHRTKEKLKDYFENSENDYVKEYRLAVERGRKL